MKSEEIESSEEQQTQQPAQAENASVDNAEGNNTEAGSEEDPLAKAQREIAEWKDKYTRLYADHENFKKHKQKEKLELISNAASDVIKELLPVIDDFDRAVKANETLEDTAVIKEGFVLIHHKLYKRLEAKGLKPIDAAGKVFDTDFHEAIASTPAPSEDMKGKVVDEVEKGYVLNDKVLRFSKVVIGQ